MLKVLVDPYKHLFNPSIFTIQDLWLWYKFEQLKDGWLPDWSGNKFDGKAYECQLIFGEKGSAFKFNGTTSYLAIKNLHFTFENPIGKFTCLAWVKIPKTGGDWSILDFDRSEYFNLVAGVPANTTIGEGDKAFFATNTIEDGVKDLWSVKSIRDGKWHLIAWIYDSSKSIDKQIWIDDKLDGEVDQHTLNKPLKSSLTRFGFVGDGSEANMFNGDRNERYFEGEIAEIRFYRRIFTSNELKRFYNPGILLCYKP